MSTLAPLLQGFFTDRLIRQRQASPHTITGYRDTWRLLVTFAAARAGTTPSQLSLADLDATAIGAFLDHLATVRHNTASTRNGRLAAIHSLFRYAAPRAPEDAALIQRVLAIPHRRTDRPLVSYLTTPEIDALLTAPDRSTCPAADWHQLLEICAMTGTLICDEDGLYDPRNFNDRLVLGMKGQISEYELHFIRARLRGGILSKARRGELVMPLPVGLTYDAAGHVILDPDTAIQGAVRHLLTTFEAVGSATAVVKAFRAAGLSFPWRHLKGPRKGETDWQPLRHSTVLHVLHNPRYAGAFTYGRHREQLLPGGKRSSITVPREEWISFIPGAHPGYITLDQWEANIARLAANAAAHGRDRAAGPPREGPALLQGIIICGRCGGRMTIRYHARGGKDLPTYLCQRDGIDNARPICAAIPGHTLDERVGQLLIDTLTPLAVEAALQVSAELQHRAAEADALRAAHVERARYHADLARRRYLAVDPANRLVADTLEADWNTALRALNDAQAAYDKAREQHDGHPHRRPEGPDQPARHRPARHLERPRHPDARAQAHRPAAAHRRHRDQDQRHHHRARPPGRRPAPHPHPASPRAGLENPADPRQPPSPRSTSCWTTTPAPRSPPSSAAAAWPTAKDGPSTPPWCSASSAPTTYAAAASGCSTPG